MSVAAAGGRRRSSRFATAACLQLLIDAAPRVVSRSEILDRVWGEDRFPTQRAIDNAVVRLRQALGDDDGQLIRSVRGVGYQWAAAANVSDAVSARAGRRAAGVPPIWLMRQAGRYHRHYQALRKRHSFDALCRTPDLAAKWRWVRSRTSISTRRSCSAICCFRSTRSGLALLTTPARGSTPA